MKVGRAIGSIIAIIMFCIGMGIYSVHSSFKNVVSEQVIGSTIDELVDTAIASGSEVILKNMPEDIKNQVSQEINNVLPKEVQKEMENVKEEIAKDPQVLALSQKYMQVLLAGSVDENTVMPDVNKDIEDIIETNVPKIADAVGSDITKEEVSNIAKEVTKKVDAQALFEKGMNMVQSSITPQQQKVLSSIALVQSSQFLIVAILLMVGSVVLVALLKKSFYKWMPMMATTSIVGGILILAGGMFAKMVAGKLTTGLPDVIGVVANGVVSSIFQSGIYFSVLGLLVIGVYFIIKFITNRVVYE